MPMNKKKLLQPLYWIRWCLWPGMGWPIYWWHLHPRPMDIPENYRPEVSLVSWPKISIVTPSYNQGQFLAETLDSVLSQNYPALEYIVQDGASTDNSLEILQEYRSQLAFVASGPDKGQADALNLGFARSTGEIMAYLNADDILLPGTLAYVAEFFQKNPEIDVLYGHRIVIDEYGQEIGRWVLPPHDERILYWADYVPQETMFWRRRIWERAGGYIDENLQFAIDWDLLLRFAKAGARIVRAPRFLGAFRVHSTQKTSTQWKTVGQVESERLRQRYLGRQVTTREIKRAIRPYLRRACCYYLGYRIGWLKF